MSVLSISRALQRVEEFLLSSAILLIAGLTCLNVFTRTALGVSLASVEEVCQLLMLVVTFIGLSYAASRGRHIRMTALYDQLPKRWQKRVMVTTAISTSVLLAALTVFAVQYIGTLQVLGTVSPALQIPLHLVYWTAPVGLSLASIQYALTAYRNLTDERIWIGFDVPEEYEDAVQPGI